MASRSRRQYATGGRDCRMGLTYTWDERERVRAAARRNGMAPAAWAAKAALDRAEGRDGAPAGGASARRSWRRCWRSWRRCRRRGTTSTSR